MQGKLWLFSPSPVKWSRDSEYDLFLNMQSLGLLKGLWQTDFGWGNRMFEETGLCECPVAHVSK